jgi:clan AA aspartic protease
MGLVYADIELINADDLALARKLIIGNEEVKKMHINMLVDSGAIMLCINENIQEYLQLPFKENRRSVMANGSIENYKVVGPVEVKFANRTATCNAIVLPGDAEPLLGAIPMEEMDVIIHPLSQKLMVHPDHPDMATLSLK